MDDTDSSLTDFGLLISQSAGFTSKRKDVSTETRSVHLETQFQLILKLGLFFCSMDFYTQMRYNVIWQGDDYGTD